MSTPDGTAGGEDGQDWVQILYVEDNQQTGPLVRDWLERHDDRFSVSLAVTIEEGIDRIDQESFDIVIADYRFPEGSGLDLLRALQRRDLDVPFLLYSARADDAVQREAREAGVDAIVHKGDSTQLGVLAERVLEAAGGTRTEPAEPAVDPEGDAETDDRLESFAVDLAHDLRGPLSLAYGHLDMVEADDQHVESLYDALSDLEAVVGDLRQRAATYDDEE